MSSITHFFLRIEDFSAKLLLKVLYIVNENLVFDKREVLLLDYLQNYTVESFPSYRVTELLVTNYLIVKYGL